LSKTDLFIPNAVELDSFLPERYPPRYPRRQERLRIAPDVFAACFVGRTGKGKISGMCFYRSGRSSFLPGQIRIADRGQRPERPALEHIARKLGIGDMVRFTGCPPRRNPSLLRGLQRLLTRFAHEAVFHFHAGGHGERTARAAAA
jgi:hypothetical protein